MTGRKYGLLVLLCLGVVMPRSADAQDPRQIKGSLFGYYNPRSSVPDGIKQALAGLGFFQSTDRATRRTEVTESTVTFVTQDWPLTNGLVRQAWVAGGVPAVYAPAIEPPDIEQPNFDKNIRFDVPVFDGWGTPKRLGGEPLSYERKMLEERQVVDPMFLRAKYDQRETSLRALNRFAILTNDVYPGGVFHLKRNESAAKAAPFIQPTRLRNDALSDVFDRRDVLRRRPKWGVTINEDNWRTDIGDAVSSTQTWQPRRNRGNSGKLDLPGYKPAYGTRRNFTKDQYLPAPGARDKGF